MSEETTKAKKQSVADEEERAKEADEKEPEEASLTTRGNKASLTTTMADVVLEEVEELQVAVPSFRPLDKILLTQREDVDTTLPQVKRDLEMIVPHFLMQKPVVLVDNVNFDLRPPDVEVATASFIPRFPHMQAPSLSTIDNFDTQRLESVAPLKKVSEEEQKELGLREVGAGGSNISGGLVDWLFKIGDGTSDLSLSQGGPLVIILSKPGDDDCEGALRIVLREIYQERHGGLPKPTIVSTEGKEKIEDELRADRSIVLVDDRRPTYFRKWVKGVDAIVGEKLRDRLLEFFSQQMGFVAFYVPENLSKHLEIELRDLLRTKGPTIVSLRMNVLSKEQKIELSKMTWGFVDSEEGPNLTSLDDFFCSGDKKFEPALARLAKRYAPYVRSNISDDQSHEGSIHLLLKQFVVGYLIRKLNLPQNAKVKDYITTEKELLDRNGKAIPDILVEHEKTVYEVETLHGVGVLDKVAETVSKYEGMGYKVNIVMKNITLLRHITELRRKKSIVKKEHGVDVDFFGIDLKNNTLVPLSSFIESVGSLFKD